MHGKPTKGVRLAVFRGGWTLAAAEAVCQSEAANEDEVLALLGSLAENSLVVADQSNDGSVRYRFLEPKRQFALELLLAGGKSPAVYRRHGNFYHALARPPLRDYTKFSQAERLRALERELDNFRVALEWSSTEHGQAPGGLRLASDLRMLWVAGGYRAEGWHWFKRLLERVDDHREDEDFSLRDRAIALTRAGHLANSLGDSAGLRLLEQSLSIWRSVKDKPGMADVLFHLGNAAYRRGDLQQAEVFLNQSACLSREVSDNLQTGLSLTMLGNVLRDRGDVVAAEEHYQESLHLQRAYGYTIDVALTLVALGLLALQIGQTERADAAFKESLSLQQELNNPEGLGLALEGLAWVANARGEVRRSIRLLAVAERLRRECGVPLGPRNAAFHEQTIAAARDRLREQFEGEWSLGTLLTSDQAVKFALAKAGPQNAPRLAPARPLVAPLTAREYQVALLVAGGRTNGQIAAKLVISEPTVASHVASILNKLGYDRRSQVGGWLASRGLLGGGSTASQAPR